MRWSLPVLLAIALCSCAPYEYPPVPVPVWIAPDVTPAVAAGYRGGMKRWNEAQGSTVFVEESEPSKCGVRVIRDELADHKGLTTPVAQCRMVTRLRADLPADRLVETATHELMHVVVLKSHNPDEHSVMNAASRKGSVITLEDIETMRGSLPDEMVAVVGTPETYPYQPEPAQ